MKLDRRRFLSTTLTVAAAAALPAKGSAASAAADSTILLWPDGPPGKPAHGPAEAIVERSTEPGIRDRAVTGTATPRLDVFRPVEPNGAAVMIMPARGAWLPCICSLLPTARRWLGSGTRRCVVGCAACHACYSFQER